MPICDGHVAGQRRHLVEVPVEGRLGLLEHRHERVAGLPGDRGAAALALVLVEPLVGEVERVLGVGGLVGHQHHSEGAGDLEAAAGVAQRGVRPFGQRRELRRDRRRPPRRTRRRRGGSRGRRRPRSRARLRPEAGQQGVADRVAEAVVVGLEAVEVEHDQRARALAARPRGQLVEVHEQAAAVRQAGESVGQRLAAGALEQPHVLAVGERHPHDHRAERGDGERERGGVHRVDRVVGEHAQGGEPRTARAAPRPGSPRSAAAAPTGRDCHAAAPIISAEAGHSVATSVLFTLPPVASMYMKKPSTTAAVARPAPSRVQVDAGPPAGEGEDRDHAARAAGGRRAGRRGPG